jgi:hypothetical protein
MRTIKITLAVLTILVVVSCAMQNNIGMITTIERSGKVHRDLYSFERRLVDEEDTIYQNPFLFDISSDWKITRFDTAIKYNFFGDEEKFNIKISKRANSIEQYSKEIQNAEDKSLAAPEESLIKKFRWFYTYYSFNATYKKLQYEVPVPIDNYLTKEEQIFWTQGGNMDKYKNLSGYEMTMMNYSDINNNFYKWYARNCFEISFEAIKKLASGYDLNADKEDLYNEMNTEEDYNITPKDVCSSMDFYYKTTYFSQLYKDNEETLKKDFEKASSIIAKTGIMISYELVIPGKLIKTNIPIVNPDTLIWKVDGMRLLFDDYTLSAEYRIANKWAFILSGLILIIAIGSLIFLIKGR